MKLLDRLLVREDGSHMTIHAAGGTLCGACEHVSGDYKCDAFEARTGETAAGRAKRIEACINAERRAKQGGPRT